MNQWRKPQLVKITFQFLNEYIAEYGRSDICTLGHTAK